MRRLTTIEAGASALSVPDEMKLRLRIGGMTMYGTMSREAGLGHVLKLNHDRRGSIGLTGACNLVSHSARRFTLLSRGTASRVGDNAPSRHLLAFA